MLHDEDKSSSGLLSDAQVLLGLNALGWLAFAASTTGLILSMAKEAIPADVSRRDRRLGRSLQIVGLGALGAFLLFSFGATPALIATLDDKRVAYESSYQLPLYGVSALLGVFGAWKFSSPGKRPR